MDRLTIYKCFHLLKQREVDGLTFIPLQLNELFLDGSVSGPDFLADPDNPICYNCRNNSYLDIDDITEYNDNIEGMTKVLLIQADEEFISIIEDVYEGEDL